MAERLDDERLEMLRAWGAGLATDGREELRAAGKAIMILIEEIERLQIDIWDARGVTGSAVAREGSEGPAEVHEPIEAVSSQSLASSLRERLGGVLPARSASDRKR
jgi:hypothetical protein